jgi:hypothetical protein
MAITIKWSVTKLRVVQQNDKPNAVTTVEWMALATADVSNLVASAAGIRQLKISDSFVPYEQLTEQQVLDWCFEPEVIDVKELDDTVTTITKNLKDEVEAQLTAQIARQLAQKQIEPALPWAQGTTP